MSPAVQAGSLLLSNLQFGRWVWRLVQSSHVADKTKETDCSVSSGCYGVGVGRGTSVTMMASI